MAESQVAIANMALTLVGESSINSLEEDAHDAARALRRVYDIVLDSALRDHNWNFAQLRRRLARHLVEPEYEFAYQYVIPADPYCLRVLETNLHADEKWRLETYQSGQERSRVIVTDAESVEILYVARMTDPTIWDGLFADAFATELAYRVSFAISHNATLTQSLQAEKERLWRAARSRDGQEGRPLKRLLSTAFIDVR